MEEEGGLLNLVSPFMKMKWQFSSAEKPFKFSIWGNCLFQLKKHLVFWYFERKNPRSPTILKKRGKPYPPRHMPLCAMSIYFKMMCARQKLRQTRVWTLAASGDRRPTDAEWASSLHLFIFPWKRNIFQELLVDMYVSICTKMMIFELLYVFFCFYFADVAYTCTLPKDSGSCDNKIFRYYYNAIEVRM